MNILFHRFIFCAKHGNKINENIHSLKFKVSSKTVDMNKTYFETCLCLGSFDTPLKAVLKFIVGVHIRNFKCTTQYMRKGHTMFCHVHTVHMQWKAASPTSHNTFPQCVGGKYIVNSVTTPKWTHTKCFNTETFLLQCKMQL